MKYNPVIVRAFWATFKIPTPVEEYRFCAGHRWRFDFAWPNYQREIRADTGEVVTIFTLTNAQIGGVAVEVQGGIWTRGRHTRGAALKMEWDKLNTAAILGWRILYCEPRQVMSTAFAKQLKAALA
jgi:hypothetical protein